MLLVINYIFSSWIDTCEEVLNGLTFVACSVNVALTTAVVLSIRNSVSS